VKPVDQTILHDSKNGKIGNCFSACVASILEIGCDDVPVFVSSGNWMFECTKWLTEKGYSFKYIDKSKPVPSGFSIGVGKSPRGEFHHSVVCLSGICIHDPHPTKAGIDGPPLYFCSVELLP
jgi:hypothetical protein